MGINPWNPDIKIAQSKPQFNSLFKTTVVKLLHQNGVNVPTQRIRQKFSTGPIFELHGLVDATIKKEDEAKAMKQEALKRKAGRDAAKVKKTFEKEGAERAKWAKACKGNHARKRKWNNRDDWKWCETCEYFGLCVECVPTELHLLVNHRSVCVAESERFEGVGVEG